MLTLPENAGSLEDAQKFLALPAKQKTRLEGATRDEKTEWISQALSACKYESLSREDKGVIRQYLQEKSGYSRAQVARFITAYQRAPKTEASVTPVSDLAIATVVDPRRWMFLGAIATLVIAVVGHSIATQVPLAFLTAGNSDGLTSSNATNVRFYRTAHGAQTYPLFVAATTPETKAAGADLLALDWQSLVSRAAVRREERLKQEQINQILQSFAPNAVSTEAAKNLAVPLRPTAKPISTFPKVAVTGSGKLVAASNVLFKLIGGGTDGQILMIENGMAKWRDFPYANQILSLPTHTSTSAERGGGSRGGGGGGGGTSTTTTVIQQVSGGGAAASGWTDGTEVVYITDSTARVGIGKQSPTTSLEVVGTISGSVVFASTSLLTSGSILWEGTASGGSLWATSINGAGLSDCDGAGSKLIWDATTGTFSCGIDLTVGTGLEIATADPRYVNQSGDTMTGALVINVTGGTATTLGLEISNTASGRIFRAQDTLASSGALVWEGSASGASLWVSTFDGAGLTDCDAASQTLAWDATNKKFSCGTDSDTTYTAGQGLSLNGSNAFSLSSSFTGTSLEIFGTSSGRRLHAQDLLTSSGGLVVEAASTFHSAITIPAGSFGVPSFLFSGSTVAGMFRGPAGTINDRIEFLVAGATALSIYDNQLMVSRGSVTAPGLAWDDATSTGFYGPSTTSVAASISGAEKFRITSTGVGILTSSPEGALEVIGTASGQIFHAQDSLRSSGTLIVDGLAYFNNYANCNLETVSGVLTCGTDDGTTYGAGQGLSLNGSNFFSLSSSFTGSSLEIYGTASGRILHAQDSLRSSGSLIAEGGVVFDAGTFTVDASNNRVGIGTTAPSNTFEIVTLNGNLILTDLGVLTVPVDVRANGDMMINTDSGAADAVLTFGSNIQNETLTFVVSEDRFVFSDDLEVIGTASGRHLFAADLLASSGAMIIEGTAKLHGATVVLAHTSFQSCTSLETSSTGAILCGSDGGTSYFAGQGLTLNGSNFFSLNSTITGSSLEIYGTASGRVMHAQDQLRSSGSLHVESNALLFGGRGNALFDGILSLGIATGDTTSGATDSVQLFVTEMGVNDARLGILSEAGEKTIIGSGTIIVGNTRGKITGNAVAAGELVLESTRNATKGTVRIGNSVFNEADTRLGIGTLTPGNELEVIGTASGRHLFAMDLLASSGALIVEGTAKLHGATVVLAHTTFQSCTALETSSTGAILCGSDGGGTVAAGQGITVNGSVVSLSSSFTGSSLEIFGTSSGRILHAQDELRSSGSLVLEGNATFDVSTLFVDASNNRVGILNTSPVHALDVTGTIHASSTLASSGGLVWEGVGSGNTLHIMHRIGIGTSSPAYSLHAVGNLEGGTVAIAAQNTNTANGSLSALLLGNDVASYVTQIFTASSNTTSYAGANSLNIYNLQAAPVATWTDNTIRMVVASNGNVSIGKRVLSPGSILSVSGSVVIGTNIGSIAADTGLALEVIGTASGRHLFAMDLLASSGSLIVEGTAKLHGATVVLAHTSFQSCTALETSSTGAILCGSDGGGTVAAGQGITVDGSVVSLTASHSGTTIEAVTLLSGAVVHAQNQLRSSGSFVAEGDITTDAGTMYYDSSGNALFLRGGLLVNDQGSISVSPSYNGSLTFIPYGSSWQPSVAGTFATFSVGPTYLPAAGTSTTLSVAGTMGYLGGARTFTGKWNGLLINQTYGNGSDSTYDGIDAIAPLKITPNINVNTASAAGYTAIFANVGETSVSATATNYLMDLQTNGVSKFVVTSVGNVGVGTSSPSTALEVIGTASGRHLFAMDLLASSGALIVEGTAKLHGATVVLAHTSFQSCTALETSSTGAILCGSDGGGTVAAGQGITVNGSVVSLSSSLSGTALEIYGTASGRILHAQDYLRSSGSLTVQSDFLLRGGDITGANGALLDLGEATSGDITVTGDFLVADDSFFGLSSTDGRFEFDNQSTDEFNILAANVGIGTSAPETTLEVIGTASGLILHAQDVLRASGSLIVEGAARFQGDILAATGAADDPSITFSSFSNAGFYGISSTAFGVSLNGAKAASFNAVGNGGYVTLTQNSSNDTAAGTPAYTFEGNTDTGMYLRNTNLLGFSTAGLSRLVIDGSGNVGIGTTSPGTSLEVIGTASGRHLFAMDLLASSGSLIVEGTAKLHGATVVLAHTSFQSCTALETSSTGAILCGSDAGGSVTAGQGITVNGSVVSLSSSFSGSSLEIHGIASGRTLRAQDLLASSGSLIVEGTAKLHGATVVLAHASFQSCTALETSSTGAILCGSDAGGAVTAGQGITVNGSVVSLSSSFSGSSLEIHGIASGRTLRAQDLLATSGSLLWEGSASGALLHISNKLSVSGSLSVTGGAAFGAHIMPGQLITINTLVSTADQGQYADIYCPTSSNCKIVWHDSDDGELEFIDCDNEACTSFTQTTIDSANDVGEEPSIYCPTSSNCKISFYDNTNGALRFTDCNDETCSAPATREIESDAGGGFTNVGLWTDISCATSTDCKIAYTISNGVSSNLRFADCNDEACTAPTLTSLDTTGNVGNMPSIDCPAVTNCKISYHHEGDGSLKLADCNDGDCDTPTLTVVDATSDRGERSSIACPSSTNCKISYEDESNGNLIFADCSDEACTAPTITVVDSVDDVAEYTDLSCPTSDNCKIAYTTVTDTGLKFMDCADETCSINSKTVVDARDDKGHYFGLACPSAANCKLAYHNNTNADLMFADCSTETCRPNVDLGGSGQYLNNTYAFNSYVFHANTSGFDVAENYPVADQTIKAGDVVALIGSGAAVGKTSTAYDPQVFGVVSSNPGLLLSNWQNGPNPWERAVALAGRVPVKISGENGDIAVGDYLTSSTISGIAMKATHAGPVLGRALGTFTGTGTGIVEVFVESFYYAGTGSGGQMTAESLTIDSSTATGSTTVFQILSNAGGLDDLVFRVTASGAVFTDGPVSTTGADYAEWFKTTDKDLAKGEVVCIDIERPNTVKRCGREADSNVMGIVSTNPAFIGNQISGGLGITPPGYVLVGLIGQVPAKVMVTTGSETTVSGSTALTASGVIKEEKDPKEKGSGATLIITGSIRPGDSLTPASIPGFARRALPGEPTVGVALEGLSSGSGVVNVLISRRNSSVTVETVEEKVLQTIADMEIQDEVNLMVREAVDHLDLDADIALEVEEQVAGLDLKTQIEELLASQTGSSVPLTGNRWNQNIIFAKEVSVDGVLHAWSDLTVSGSILADRITISSSALIKEDLFVQGALKVESIDAAGDITAGGTVHAAALEASGALIRGTVNIEGTLMINGEMIDLRKNEPMSGSGIVFASGSSVDLSALVVKDSLVVLGNITVKGFAQLLGDVEIGGELIVSNRQAGYALIPKTGTSVTVRFDPPMSAQPVVTASSNAFAAWRIRNQSATGFVLEVAVPAEESIIFSWHSFSTKDPKTVENTGATILQLIPFPVDGKGVPVSSNDIWNSCIRNLTMLDSEGQPYSCARYHVENDWTHPDLIIEFNWNSERVPALILPEGFEAMVVMTEESEDSEDFTIIGSSDSSDSSVSSESSSSVSSESTSSMTSEGESSSAVSSEEESSEAASVPADELEMPETVSPALEEAPLPEVIQ